MCRSGFLVGLLGLTGLLGLAASCESAAPDVCKVVCTIDAECPSGQLCGDLGRCSDGAACPCEPDEFLGCVEAGASALFCNATGDGVMGEACGGGCNADASRCNTCVPEAATCSADRMAVTSCAADGLAVTTESCALGCVGTTPTASTHCGHIAPAYLDTVCDQPATLPSLDITSATTLDTNLTTTCTGGIVTQAAGAEICVIRYGTITIGQSLRVTGSRAVAFVADRDLVVSATVDLSAVGGVSGPGGGRTLSGERVGVGRGGGGAGFKHAGANGGALTMPSGGIGGVALVPTPAATGFLGGPRPASPTVTQQQQNFPGGGGGGGAVLLIACRGTVTVAGGLHANGGGGGGSQDIIPVVGMTAVASGGGGGAGGFIAIQGAKVIVTGRLHANGGGGGGGCDTDGCAGLPGQDGQRSTVAARGGSTSSEFGIGTGGFGGTTGVPSPGSAGSGFGAGGGGGSSGYLQIFTATGITPTNTPIEASPAVELMTVPSR